MEYVREVAEYINTVDGKISASMLMERFLFDGTMQWTPIGRLSGGERRRLYLLRVLMGAPNVLILDEPTNDLDISTLTILEDYLDAFDGIVIIVSHDRYFLERLVSRIFAFEGEGHLQQYEGGYLDYIRLSKAGQNKLPETAETQKKKKKASDEMENITSKGKPRFGEKKLKFTYKEQQEYATIEDDIHQLEIKLEQIEKDMAENSSNSAKLLELVKEKEQAEAALEDKMDRWVYLNDLAEKITAQNEGRQ